MVEFLIIGGLCFFVSVYLFWPDIKQWYKERKQ